MIVYIPARGGSTQVIRKNLLPIQGVPLIQRTIDLALEFTVPNQVYVSSDDDTILAIARSNGVQTIRRPKDLIDVTVDRLVEVEAWPLRGKDKKLLVIQPTVVGVRLGAAIDEMIDANGRKKFGVALAKPTHGIWADSGMSMSFYHQIDNKRSNRQDLARSPLQEIGIRYYGHTSHHLGSVHEVLTPIIDIDTAEDYQAAKTMMGRKTIVFRYASSKEIGSGHLRRAVTLADQLQHHDVYLQKVGGNFSSATEKKILGNWVDRPRRVGMPIDLIVNDALDTTEDDMIGLRSAAPVIALEDRGEGARLANRVINALYEDGSKWADLRPEFLAVRPKPIKDRSIDVLVTFGGTDPANLTDRLHKVFLDNGIENDFNVVWVNPPGRSGKSFAMAELLSDAKMVFTSGGRTVFEAAACATPAFVICQNALEFTHTHFGFDKGNYNLGHHDFVTRNKILALFPLNRTMLEEMSALAYASIDRKGTERIIKAIEQTLLEVTK